MTLTNMLVVVLFANLTLHAMDEDAPLLRHGNPHIEVTIQDEQVDYRRALLVLHDDILRGKKKYTDLDVDPLFTPENYAHLSNALPAFNVDGASSHLREYLQWRETIERGDYEHFQRLTKSFSLKLAQEIWLPEGSDFFEKNYRYECAKKCPTFCSNPDFCCSILPTREANSRLSETLSRESDRRIKTVQKRLQLAHNFFQACYKHAENNMVTLKETIFFTGNVVALATLASFGTNTLIFSMTSHPYLVGSCELLGAAASLVVLLKGMSIKEPRVKIVQDLEMLETFMKNTKAAFEQRYWQY